MSAACVHASMTSLHLTHSDDTVRGECVQTTSMRPEHENIHNTARNGVRTYPYTCIHPGDHVVYGRPPSAPFLRGSSDRMSEADRTNVPIVGGHGGPGTHPPSGASMSSMSSNANTSVTNGSTPQSVASMVAGGLHSPPNQRQSPLRQGHTPRSRTSRLHGVHTSQQPRQATQPWIGSPFHGPGHVPQFAPYIDFDPNARHQPMWQSHPMAHGPYMYSGFPPHAQPAANTPLMQRFDTAAQHPSIPFGFPSPIPPMQDPSLPGAYPPPRVCHNNLPVYTASDHYGSERAQLEANARRICSQQGVHWARGRFSRERVHM